MSPVAIACSALAALAALAGDGITAGVLAGWATYRTLTP